MQRLTVLAVIMALLGGCAGLQLQSAPCTVYEAVGATPENSIIASKIHNPCQAQRLLVTAVEMPIIWSQQKYIESFDKWVGILKSTIEAGVSLSDLQGIILTKVAAYNAEMGMALLIVSNNLLVFDSSYEIMGPYDKILVLMSLDNLSFKVHRMARIGLMKRGML